MTQIPDDDITPPSEFPAEPADDALVHRLRRLTWPTVKADVRDRCWEKFAARVASGEPRTELPQPTETGPDTDGSNAGRSESYTRRQPVPRDPLAGYSQVPRRWTERPKQRFATLCRDKPAKYRPASRVSPRW